MYKGVLDCGQYDSSLGNHDFTLDPDLDKAYVIPGSSGWGLRRGQFNRDGSACAKVNYSCNLDNVAGVASCTYDKLSGQQATFKFVFVFPAKPADSTGPTKGWTNYRPQVSWNVPNLDLTSTNFDLPDWVPLLACVDDMFPSTNPPLPTVLLPKIPSGVLPFSDTTNNTHLWYQPGQMALMCGAQLGWTSSGDTTTGTVMIQHWLKVIDEADSNVKFP